jgi:hypothetical protein
MKQAFLILFLSICASSSYAQGTIPVPISTDLFFGNQDEWIHLKITDTLTNQVWYDTMATVTVSDGFIDTVYLDSATYKCEVLDIGANVSMPTIELDDGSYAVWGYPDYLYYLFTLPHSSLGEIELKSNAEITVYPNPTVDVLHLNIPEAWESVEVRIINGIGQVILTKEIIGNELKTLNTSTLIDGVYFVHIESENQLEVIRILKIGQ